MSISPYPLSYTIQYTLPGNAVFTETPWNYEVIHLKSSVLQPGIFRRETVTFQRIIIKIKYESAYQILLFHGVPTFIHEVIPAFA